MALAGKTSPFYLQQAPTAVQAMALTVSGRINFGYGITEILLLPPQK